MTNRQTDINLWNSFQFMTDEQKVIQALIQLLWSNNVINKRPDSIVVNDTMVTIFFNDGYLAISHQLNDLMAGIGHQDFIDKINQVGEE